MKTDARGIQKATQDPLEALTEQDIDLDTWNQHSLIACTLDEIRDSLLLPWDSRNLKKYLSVQEESFEKGYYMH